MAGEEAYLEKAINRYSPAVAATARAGLKKMRVRFPGARLLVFERRQSLPIGFAPAERGNPVFRPNSQHPDRCLGEAPGSIQSRR